MFNPILKPLLSVKVASFFAVSLLISACGSSSSDNTANEKQQVEIQFAARVGNDDIRCESMTNSIVGTTNTVPTFHDVRMYISEVSLINAQGDAVSMTLTQDSKWQYKNVALLDFEEGKDTCSNGNADTNNKISGTIPPGEYHGIEFTLGVPAALNHYGIDGDDRVSPLDVTGMNWSWQNGHKHLRIDVSGWNLHLGTTGCEVVQGKEEEVDCVSSRPNRPRYQFDNFDLTMGIVVFDYQKLVANSDVSANTDGTPLGCMSSSVDADCQAIFDNLGLDLIGGQCLAGNCSSSQTWVSVE